MGKNSNQQIYNQILNWLNIKHKYHYMILKGSNKSNYFKIRKQNKR